MSRSDIVLWDRSVTFRHNNIKGKEYWSKLIYLISRNLFFKWVWCGGMSPHRCAWCWDWWCTYYGVVVVNGLCVCFLPPVKYCSWFYIIIQCILVSILSWPMITTQYVFLVLTLLVFSSLFFCGVQQVYHRLRLALSSIQSPAH